MLHDVLVSAAWYLACIAGVHAAYGPMGRVLTRWYGPKYADLPAKDRAYSCKNAIKSAMLALAMPLTMYVLTQRLLTGRWQVISTTRAIGSLYAANDVVALAKVPLPPNTRVHHSCVAVLSVLNLFMDYTRAESVWTNVVMLCGLSMVPYLVNLYLGLRKIEQSRVLAGVGLFAYVPSLCVNAAWQYSHIALALSSEPASALGYCAVVTLIFWDDLVLIRHLYRVTRGPDRPKKNATGVLL